MNPMNKTNEFIMTKWGLKNTYLQNNPEENLMQRIDEEMEAIISNPVLKRDTNAKIRNEKECVDGNKYVIRTTKNTVYE